MRRISLIEFVFLLASMALAIGAYAQDASSGSRQAHDLSVYENRPRVQAVGLAETETISIDGKLDEAVWQRAVPAGDFTQQDPDSGTPATERTEVRFLFSRNTLYMGVICFDSEPDKLMGNTMQRDAALGAGDRFQWTFDPYLDERSGYFFEVNSSGAMGDALLGTADQGNNSAARAWDGIWYAKVDRSGIGWTIEIEIPFRTLNFNPSAPAWGLNIQRTVKRKNEESLWTGWRRNEGLRRMSNAGLLEGISDVSQGIGLNVQPYATGNYKDFSGRNLGSSYKGDGGIDFIYNITPQLKGNFTINTDFAETEVDQRRVNLTRFPLFFPERRGFFLEGTTVFDFARETGNTIVPFFSRRIGLDANGAPQRIDYGAKITGRIGANDIGLIHVRTAGSDQLIGEDFTVVRTRKRFFLQSYAGMINTRRAERKTTAPGRQTAGVDFVLSTSRFRGSRNLELSGYYPWNTRPGIDSRRAAYGFRLDHSNEPWDAHVSVREIQPGYDPAMGFVDRSNVRAYRPALGYTFRPKNTSVVRSLSFDSIFDVYTDLHNRLLTRDWDYKVFHLQFQSGDNFQVHVLPTYERLENDFEISKGITLPGGSAYSFIRYSVQVQTSNRRIIQVHPKYEVGNFYSGNRRDFSSDVGIRPRTGVAINLNNEWNRAELAEGNFSTSVLRLNADTQFSPWMSIVNILQYDSVSRVMGLQFRYRWILRPGNDFYFVYAHNWLDAVSGHQSTLDRTVATNIVYTDSF